MFGKMMNRYYYGKSGKGDYTKEDLPQNRWQLFWETLRVRFMALVRLNLMYAVAWLPTIAVIGYGLGMLYAGGIGMMNMQAEVEAGTMAAEAFSENVALFQSGVSAIAIRTLLMLIPCIALTGPFTAGLCYVTRNWARDEHAFIWSDFRDAVKENWKQGLATSAITSVMPLVLYVCCMFYGEQAKANPVFIVPQVLSISVVLIWLCSLMYTYPQMVTYRLTYRDLIKNSIFITIARLPATIGLKLLSLVPALICAAVAVFTLYVEYAMLALALYYILLGFSLSRFVGASYSNAVFDKLINVRIEGAEVGKGLYVEEDEDDEDDEDENENIAPSGSSHEV